MNEWDVNSAMLFYNVYVSVRRLLVMLYIRCLHFLVHVKTELAMWLRQDVP